MKIVSKDEQTTNEIASAHGIHPKLVREWKGLAVQGLASLYERRDQLAGQAAAHDKQVDELYAEIGRLTTQLNWLKKTSPVVCAIPPGEQRSRLPLDAHTPIIGSCLPKARPRQPTGVRSPHG